MKFETHFPGLMFLKIYSFSKYLFFIIIIIILLMCWIYEM